MTDPRLLLIDDDPDDRALARLILKTELGHIETQEVLDALSFAQACVRRDFDLVLLEQKLHWAEGLGVLKLLKAEWPEIPVIFCTRHGSEEVSAEAARLGAADYLTKRPGDLLKLPQAVGAALAGHPSRLASGRRRVELSPLLHQAGMGFFSVTTGGRLLDATPVFLDLLGLDSLEEAERVDLSPLAAWPENGDAAQEMKPVQEIRLARADGRPVWLRVIRSVLRDAGVKVRIDGLAEDITERKLREEALPMPLSAEEDTQHFALMAAHELQKPVRQVERYARVLQEEYKERLDEEANQLIDRVGAAAHRLQTLVESLVSLARVDSRTRAFEAVDTEELLDEALLSLKDEVEASGATVSRSPMPTLHADPVQFVQLLENLIGNALRFRGEEPPRILVSAARTGASWVFSIHDNGVGIDPEEVELIFTPFKRLRPEVPGNGLGLAICRRIAERHGGRIWARSEAGQGATFFFTIPADR